MNNLNYHHLRYFRAVAHEGNLTRAAERLNLSQSALSSQIRALEDRLGQPLFDRVGRRLELTEVGRVALAHADRIFAIGAELTATLARDTETSPPLRIGAQSTLSRNFQLQFLRPVLGRPDLRVSLRSGQTEGLLAALDALDLDVVLTTEAPARTEGKAFAAHRIADQAVAIHGRSDRLQYPDLRTLLAAEAFILPTESAIRAGFDGLAQRLGVTPTILAEVDDMAMVRLLAREGAGLAVAPSVVVADEIAGGRLATAPFDLGIVETFFAVTRPRQFPHPLLPELLRA